MEAISSLDPYKWHYIAITWSDSANQKSLYVDRVLRGSSEVRGPVSGVLIGLNKLRPDYIDIGALPASGGSTHRTSNADIDSVRITSRAKTSTEIAQTMYEGQGQ